MIGTLTETALRSLLLAFVVWAGLRAFRMRNVLAQKAAWSGVLVAAMLMPLLVSMAARWPVLPAAAGVVLPANPMTLLEELRATLESRRAAARRPSQPAPLDPPQIEETAASAPDDASSQSAPVSVESTPDNARPAEYAQPQPVARRLAASPGTLIVLLYLVGVVALLCRLFYGLGSAFRIWQMAEPVEMAHAIKLAAGMPVRASAAVASPVTIGSAVVLPANYGTWDVEKLRIVLAHERSHIRQGDFYLQLIAGFYASVFWFSPLGWWLKRQLSDLAEAISDRAA